jgi:hypothetical protein
VKGETAGTVAFFGLVRSGDELVAVGLDGIYRLRDGKVAEVAPVPTFKAIGGVGVSFELPGAILVLTANTPMLVPR